MSPLRPYALTPRLGWSFAAAGAIGAVGAIVWSIARHEPGDLLTPQPAEAVAWALGTGLAGFVAALLAGLVTFPRMTRAEPAPADAEIEIPHRSARLGDVAILVVAAVPPLVGGIADEGHQYLAAAGGGVAGAAAGVALVARRVRSWERSRGVRLVGGSAEDRAAGEWYTVAEAELAAGGPGVAEGPRVALRDQRVDGMSLHGRLIAYAIGVALSLTGVAGAVASRANPSWLPFGPPGVGKCVEQLGFDLEVRACWDRDPAYVITERGTSEADCGGLSMTAGDDVWCMRERD